MEKETKLKVKGTVDAYIDVCRDEYHAFLKQLKVKQDSQLNDFAAVANFKGSAAFERWNYDLPENLYDSLKYVLSDKEWTEFTSHKGTLWFMKNFKQFVGPKII